MQFYLYYQGKQKSSMRVHSTLEHFACSWITGTFFSALFTGIHCPENHSLRVHVINLIILEKYKGEKKYINKLTSEPI